MKILTKLQSSVLKTAGNEDGVLAYGIAWILGVPLSVLVVLYLVFGR